jgi:hypothetical protein
MTLFSWSKKQAPASTVYCEFPGGLGDVVNYMYTSSRYNRLETLEPDERATVVLLCHNPFAKELFEWHPKRSRMTVRDFGFWWPSEDHIQRPHHGLPPAPQPYVASLQEKCIFHVSPADLQVLAALKTGKPYLAIGAAAGGVDRNIPAEICERSADLAIDRGWSVAVVGRTYGQNRSEIRLRPRPGIIDLVDRLSIPGTAMAIEGASGVLCCHSAVCLLSWYMKRPVFVLYPEHVQAREFGAINHYSFGKDYPTTRHMEFSQYSRERFDEFLSIAGKR